MIKPLLLACLCSVSSIGAANSLLNHKQNDKMLNVDEAFRLMPIERDGKHLRISWEVAPKHYLYREHLSFEAVAPKNSILPTPRLPKAEIHHDDHFGDVHVYRNMKLTADFTLPKSSTAPTSIRVRYQGCADIGICYPPQTRIISVPR